MAHKGRTIAVCSYTPPPENFNENYSFDKKTRLTPREELVGLSKWDKKYRDRDKDSPYIDPRPKEDAFQRGAPSKFRETKPAGKLRVSGTKGAHRIGKR